MTVVSNTSSQVLLGNYALITDQLELCFDVNKHQAGFAAKAQIPHINPSFTNRTTLSTTVDSKCS